MGTAPAGALRLKPGRLGLAFASLLLIGAAPQADSEGAAAQRVRAHVEFLSSDLLEGRETGSKGLEIASSYVASQFRSLGLEPSFVLNQGPDQADVDHANRDAVEQAGDGRREVEALEPPPFFGKLSHRKVP